MTRNTTKYTSILAGVMGLSTLIMFHQGAEALDLSDFSGADQKVITKDAPKAGGIVLVKEKVVYPKQLLQMRAVVAQPMARGTNYPTPASNTASSFNAITPAAGGTSPSVRYGNGDGSIGTPGKGLHNKTDITTMPGNAFDQAQAKFSGAAPSAPVDGKPLTTTTLANGQRVNDLAEIAPAAGSPARNVRATTPVAVDSGKSIQSMTGRGSSSYNN